MNTTIDPATIPGYRAATWKADPARSAITFSIRQLFARMRGEFTHFEVTIVTNAEPAASLVTADIDLASVDTGNAKRDRHLRGPKYLRVDRFSRMTYRSTAVQRADQGLVIDGTLELHGRTIPVPLVIEAHEFTTDLAGNVRASFVANARVSRKAIGLTVPGAAGGLFVGDKVSIRLRMEALLAD